MTDLAASLDGQSLIIRTDASAAIGTGHMMRELALAEAWLDLGGTASWLVAEAPDSLLARIAGEGMAVERVVGTAGGPADVSALRRRLLADRAAIASIDGLNFDSRYLASLDPGRARVLLVDDMAPLATYPVGFVLNQNAHADRADYPAESTCRFLLGLRFVLLRREFRRPPVARTIPTSARHLLVTFGGSDPSGLTARTMDAIRSLPADLLQRLEVRVVVGPANRDGHRILEEAASRSDLLITVISSVTDMAAQVEWADLTVTSGGSTVWELARLGCPALVVATVPAETRLVAGLSRVGLFSVLGPAAGLDGSTIADEIAAKVQDGPWRAAMSSLGMHLVDGDGAQRVAQAIAGRDIMQGS